VHQQTFVSIAVTQKFPKFWGCDTLMANERFVLYKTYSCVSVLEQ